MTEVVVVIVVVVVVVVVIDCFFLNYRFHDSIYINHLIVRKDTFTFRFQNYSTYVKTTYEEKTTASKYENFRLIFKSKFLSNNFNIIDFRLTIKFLSILKSNILL